MVVRLTEPYFFDILFRRISFLDNKETHESITHSRRNVRAKWQAHYDGPWRLSKNAHGRSESRTQTLEMDAFTNILHHFHDCDHQDIRISHPRHLDEHTKQQRLDRIPHKSVFDHHAPQPQCIVRTLLLGNHHSKQDHLNRIRPLGSLGHKSTTRSSAGSVYLQRNQRPSLLLTREAFSFQKKTPP